MAIANQDEQQQQSGEAGKQPSKAGEMGKKFGKKLGNAAIFGAGKSHHPLLFLNTTIQPYKLTMSLIGATLGADLVNSIFWVSPIITL